MDVAAWLRDLGLGRYVSAFRDNDIDAEVLLKLTAEDLISIGVTSVGHRRKLLDAIAGLGMAMRTAEVAGSAPDAPSPVDAERRQEHTSELQSLRHLVCRLLLEKKKIGNRRRDRTNYPTRRGYKRG